MKVKELNEILTSMEYRLRNIHESEDLKKLLDLYENLSLNSGYYFSNTPNELFRELNTMMYDIIEIRRDIRDKINEKSDDIEL